MNKNMNMHHNKNVKRIIVSFSILVLIGGGFLFVRMFPAEKPYNYIGRWELVFQDDFNGHSLDTTVWSSMVRGSAWNEEDQAYVKENVSVKDGNLVLTSKKENWEGYSMLYDAPYKMVKRDFTSALVHSKDKKVWKYGRFEVSAKPVKSSGMISALWLMPSDGKWPPEIDIMEVLGDSANFVHMTNHWEEEGEHMKNQGTLAGTVDYTQGFHTYSVEWEPGIIRWFVDGVQQHESRDKVPDNPFYIIFSPAVGSEWTGNATDKSVFPNEFLIDWVKIYQREPLE